MSTEEQLKQKIDRLKIENRQLQEKLNSKPSPAEIETALNNIPPDPNTVEIKAREVPTPSNSDNTLLTFQDGTTMYIKREWLEKSKLLANNSIIYEDPKKFVNYIMPVLKGDNTFLYSNENDELNEISQLCEEVKKYGLEACMSDKMLIQISDKYGLNTVLNKIQFLTTHLDGFMNRKKKKIYDAFKNEWTKYINLRALELEHEEYKKLTADYIENQIKILSYVEISRINFMYDNIIFTYCFYLEKAITNKTNEAIMELNLQLMNNNISEGLTSAVSNGVDFVKKLLQFIPTNPTTAFISTAINTVETAVNLTNK